MFFWKKNKIEFNKGDSVKIKDGVKFPKLKIDISDWHGRVFEVDKKSVELELDSLTLISFNDTLFKHFQDLDEYPHILTIPKKELELAESRDTFEDVEIAQDEIIKRLDANNTSEPNHYKLIRKWTRHFQRSQYYSNMDKVDRLNSDFVIEAFSNHMYDYEGKSPKKWNVRAAKEVFLNWAPNKISADKEVFESYGIVLLNFFKFLDQRKYLNTTSLQKIIINLKDEIVTRSQDSSQWGMAKSFIMGAKNSGVNLDDKKAMDKFLFKQQIKALKQLKNGDDDLTENTNSVYKQVNPKQFKGIWRNQKITVKYRDGKILEKVKFKEVEQDLLNGVCELIEK